MQNDEMRSYVVSERARGVHEEDIKSALLAKGWNADAVTSIMSASTATITSTLPGELISGLDLLKRTYAEMMEHLTLILTIVGVPVILMALPPIAEEYGISMGSMSMVGFGALSLVGGILSVLATIGIIKQMRAGWTLNLEGTYAVSTKYFWSMFWVSLLTGFVVLGGMVLFIIPGIYFAGLLAFARTAVVLEDKKGIAALSFSAELVTGFWWPVLWRFIVLLLPFIIVAIVMSFIPYVKQLTSLLTLPFSIIYSVHLYDALKLAHPVDPETTIGKRKGMFIGFAIFGFIIIPVIITAIIFAYMMYGAGGW